MADKGIIKQHPAPAVLAEPLPAGVVPGTLEYPDPDGRFLPENPLQANAILDLRSNLKQHFRDQQDVVVEGDMFLYYEKGQADERLGPQLGLPGSVRSDVLGVSLRPEGALLRVRDLRSGTDYLWNVELIRDNEAQAAARREAEAARREAEHRAEREAAARKAVEARLAAFEARLGHGGQHPTDAG